MVSREPSAELLSHLVDVAAVDAAPRPDRIERVEGLHAGRRELDYLARLDLADVFGIDEIVRARLRGDDPAFRRTLLVREPPEHERPEAVGVARGDHLVLGKQ